MGAGGDGIFARESPVQERRLRQRAARRPSSFLKRASYLREAQTLSLSRYMETRCKIHTYFCARLARQIWQILAHLCARVLASHHGERHDLGARLLLGHTPPRVAKHKAKSLVDKEFSCVFGKTRHGSLFSQRKRKVQCEPPPNTNLRREPRGALRASHGKTLCGAGT